MKALREELGLSQENLGNAIGIDESSSRARNSQCELSMHEPPRSVRISFACHGGPIRLHVLRSD